MLRATISNPALRWGGRAGNIRLVSAFHHSNGQFEQTVQLFCSLPDQSKKGTNEGARPSPLLMSSTAFQRSGITSRRTMSTKTGMPEIIEKWGPGPFYKTCVLMSIFSAGSLAVFDSPLVSAILGIPTAAFTIIGLHDLQQKQHAILRNFPVLGHARYIFESVRPEIRQYFVESDQEATPFTRENRSLVYQRAKGDVDTIPFGTRRNVYDTGFEWVNHSMYPKEHVPTPRVSIGSTPNIKYSASLFNVSAMSFGAISANAVLALNEGAKLGSFFHNTGEGGVSKFHLEKGGDVVWNIGTGYFSCRNPATHGFDPKQYKAVVSHPSIRMTEIKLSQGAKPGEGGILPSSKITKEIADTRGIPMGKDCISPPAHKAFSDARGLIRFANELRTISQKPVGIKLCVGSPVEFAEVVAAMVESNTYVDFVTVDGKEGGTGAAPAEYSNHVGMPLVDGLYVVHNLLVGAGIRDKVKVIASGKVTSGFGLFRALALGADAANSARGMMFALGCIQSLKCHTNKCPTGVATQDLELQKGLVVEDKATRVFNFQRKTVESCLHLIGSAGLEDTSQLNSSYIMVRTDNHTSMSYDKIRPPLHAGELMVPSARDHELKHVWSEAMSRFNKNAKAAELQQIRA